MQLPVILASALAATLVSGHPAVDVRAEVAERRSMLGRMARTDLSHCAEKIKARGLEARAVARRSELLSELLMKSGELDGRDLVGVLGNSHHSDKHYDLKTQYEVIFGSNSSCVLSPETTEGPFYIEGEFVRKNVHDHQPGIDLTLDFQVLDMETCDPVPNVFVEIWHTDVTGTYSGVASNDHIHNIDATYGRGLRKTDSEGVVSFETVFPGRYSRRTNHIHVMVHPSAQELSNGTVLDNTASHVGQIYFDQSLIYKVQNSSVYYKSNRNSITPNEDDEFFTDTAESSDPVVQYVELGHKIEDGLLAWISFGINKTLSTEVSVAGTPTKDGGVPGHNLDVPQDEKDWHTKPGPPGWRTIMKKDVDMEDTQVTPIYLPPKSIWKRDEDAQVTKPYLPPKSIWRKDENAQVTRPYLPPKSIWKKDEDAQVTPIYLPPKSIWKKDEDAQAIKPYLPPKSIWKKDEDAQVTPIYLPPKSTWKKDEDAQVTPTYLPPKSIWKKDEDAQVTRPSLSSTKVDLEEE